jgi:hypothetical protein
LETQEEREREEIGNGLRFLGKNEENRVIFFGLYVSDRG